MADPSPPTLPSSLPVLPLRETVAFPLSVLPLAVNRPVSVLFEAKGQVDNLELRKALLQPLGKPVGRVPQREAMVQQDKNFHRETVSSFRFRVSRKTSS